MRVLGLAADDSFAVLDTDGRAIEAFGPAGRGAAAYEGIDLIGLQSGDAEALARKTGLPVAHDFGASPALKAVYYRTRVRALGLERPLAVIDGDVTVSIARNGLLGLGPRHRTVVAADLAATPGFIEAETVAYLAARCWNGQPIAFPKTTGAPYPMTVGRIARP